MFNYIGHEFRSDVILDPLIFRGDALIGERTVGAQNCFIVIARTVHIRTVSLRRERRVLLSTLRHGGGSRPRTDQNRLHFRTALYGKNQHSRAQAADPYIFLSFHFFLCISHLPHRIINMKAGRSPFRSALLRL